MNIKRAMHVLIKEKFFIQIGVYKLPKELEYAVACLDNASVSVSDIPPIIQKISGIPIAYVSQRLSQLLGIQNCFAKVYPFKPERNLLEEYTTFFLNCSTICKD